MVLLKLLDGGREEGGKKKRFPTFTPFIWCYVHPSNVPVDNKLVDNELVSCSLFRDFVIPIPKTMNCPRGLGSQFFFCCCSLFLPVFCIRIYLFFLA